MGGVRSGKLCVAPVGIHLSRCEQRGLLWQLVGGPIEMPEEVALPVPGQHAICLARVERDGRYFGIFVLPGRADHHFTEKATEGNEILVADCSSAVHDDAVTFESRETLVGNLSVGELTS